METKLSSELETARTEAGFASLTAPPVPDPDSPDPTPAAVRTEAPVGPSAERVKEAHPAYRMVFGCDYEPTGMGPRSR